MILCASAGAQISVDTCGADPTGLTDSTPAFLACKNTACAGVAGDNHVALSAPGLKYKLSQPFHLDCSNIALAGSGNLSTKLFAAFNGGPLVVVAPSVTNGYCAGTGCATDAFSPKMVPSILTCAAPPCVALQFDGSNRYWLDLRHNMPTMELNGLSQFTAEATVYVPSCVNTKTVLASSGRRMAGEPVTNAFFLGFNGCNAQATMTVNGVFNNLFLAAVAPGWHHIAETFDGSAINVWVDGALFGARTASGTITQPLTEDVTMGVQIQDWPEAGLLNGTPAGTIYDSIRVSRSVRYTAPFTPPTAKFNLDSNCLLLINWTNQQDIFEVAQNYNGNVWLPLMLQGNFGVSHVTVRDLQLDSYAGSGLYVFHATNGNFSNLELTPGPGSASSIGLFDWNNSFENTFNNDESTCSGATCSAMLFAVQAGVNEITHPLLAGAVGIALAGGSLHITMPFYAVTSTSQFPLLFKGSGDNSTVTVTGTGGIDNESFSANWKFGLGISNMEKFSWTDAEIENAQVWVDQFNKQSIVFYGGKITLASGAASVVHFLGTPARPVTFFNTILPAGIPASDAANGAQSPVMAFVP